MLLSKNEIVSYTDSPIRQYLDMKAINKEYKLNLNKGNIIFRAFSTFSRRAKTLFLLIKIIMMWFFLSCKIILIYHIYISKPFQLNKNITVIITCNVYSSSFFLTKQISNKSHVYFYSSSNDYCVVSNMVKADKNWHSRLYHAFI